MKAPEDCKNMEDIRESIDSLDTQIVELIARRSDYVKAAAQFKTDPTSVRDEERVQQVLKSKAGLADKFGISRELICGLYSQMIDFFIAQEMDEWRRENLKQ